MTRFFRKRVLRIFPLYWAALFVYVIVYNVLPLKTLVAGHNPTELGTFFSNMSVSSTLVYILGLQGPFSPPANNHISGVWFVGSILVYYAIYPLIIIFSSRIAKFIAISGLVYVALLALQLVLHTIVPELFIFYGAFVGGVFASKYALVDKLAYLANEVRYPTPLPTGISAAAVSVGGLYVLCFSTR
ncbi:MAG: hypothetical protein ACXVH6_02520 [Halobacteriota archaeon]